MSDDNEYFPEWEFPEFPDFDKILEIIEGPQHGDWDDDHEDWNDDHHDWDDDHEEWNDDQEEWDDWKRRAGSNHTRRAFARSINRQIQAVLDRYSISDIGDIGLGS